MFDGEKVIELLRDKGVTQATLMDYMGWKSSNQFYQFVKGNPCAKNLEKVCDFLDISIDTIFVRERQQQTPQEDYYLKREAAFMKLIEQQKATIDSLHELLKQYNQ